MSEGPPIGFGGSTLSETQIGQAGMAIRTTTKRPAILAVRFRDRKVVDAGQSPPHQTVLVEFPVLVAVRPVPVPGIVVPLVGEAHRDPVPLERPQLFDQAIVQLLRPL